MKTEQEHPQTYCESFCACKNRFRSDTLQCSCGEEYDIYEWTWDKDHLTRSVYLSENEREVTFHQTFSSGTAAVRGKLPFGQNRHYYWEIKMLTALYGTDVMVGVGTEKVNINLWPYRFCSLLGGDSESWGYSYRGNVQHKGKVQVYGPRFGKGSIIGVHLDTCAGTIEFYHNRKPLGVAFSGLKGIQLYPMVSSTAAQSAMRMTCALSVPPNLQLLSLLALRERSDNSLMNIIDIVPGLRNMLAPRLWWLMRSNTVVKVQTEDYVNKRKRKRLPCTDDTNTSAEADCDSPRVATCENCGIHGMVSRQAAHYRTRRLCVFCDLIV